MGELAGLWKETLREVVALPLCAHEVYCVNKCRYQMGQNQVERAAVSWEDRTMSPSKNSIQPSMSPGHLGSLQIQVDSCCLHPPALARKHVTLVLFQGPHLREWYPSLASIPALTLRPSPPHSMTNSQWTLPCLLISCISSEIHPFLPSFTATT